MRYCSRQLKNSLINKSKQEILCFLNEKDMEIKVLLCIEVFINYLKIGAFWTPSNHIHLHLIQCLGF